MTERARVSLLCLNGQHETCMAHRDDVHRKCGCDHPSHAAARTRLVTVSDLVTPETIARRRAADPELDAWMTAAEQTSAGPEDATPVASEPPTVPGPGGTPRGPVADAPVASTPAGASLKVSLTAGEVRRITGAHLELRTEAALAVVRDIIEERLTNPEGAR